MKKLINVCLILLLVSLTVFCVTACQPQDTATYEITVDAQQVSVDMSSVKVCVYSLDGTAVAEQSLSDGKAQFELTNDSYVATLSGLSEEVSFSSVLLNNSNRKATITLEQSQCDEFDEFYSFAFTVVLLTGDRNIDDLSVDVCDAVKCETLEFDKSNVAVLYVVEGECEIKVNASSNGDTEEIYHDNHTIDLNKRFYVIAL